MKKNQIMVMRFQSPLVYTEPIMLIYLQDRRAYKPNSNQHGQTFKEASPFRMHKCKKVPWYGLCCN